MEGWDLLGFELLAGRTADIAPGSADLAKVVAAARLADCAARDGHRRAHVNAAMWDEVATQYRPSGTCQVK